MAGFRISIIMVLSLTAPLGAQQGFDLLAFGPYRSDVPSHEKKRLFLAVFSSEDNLRRTQDLRQQNPVLADPRDTSQSQADAISRRAPVVVWLDCGNDGNETANLEAGLACDISTSRQRGVPCTYSRLRRCASLLKDLWA